MRLIPQLYYRETQSAIHCGRVPTGRLSLKELIAGNPFWIMPSSQVAKQKTLVLADWTAGSWALNRIDDVKKALADLMVQGFSIYIWHDGKVLPLNRDHLADLDTQRVRKGMTLASTEEVTQAAVAQNKLSRDQIQVIDDYWLNHILSDNKEPAPRALRVSEMHSVDFNKLINILIASSIKLEKIIHDDFSSLSNRHSSEVFNHLVN